MQLYYVGLRVRNLRRSLHFYTEVMGLREMIRGDFRKEGKGIWVGLDDPNSHSKLELNWYPPHSKFGGRYSSGDGLDHIGFLLGRVSRRRLEQEYLRLLRNGARPTAVTPKSSDGWQACVLDPDGNWIELFRWPTAAERRMEERASRRSSSKRS